MTQKFFTGNADTLDFWSKTMRPPYSPDANPLDYAFWPHIQSLGCGVGLPNIATLKASVDDHFDRMSEDIR